MVQVKEKQPIDFMLVVEGTANMVTHWESLKKHYILPAMRYFNGGPPSSNNFLGNYGYNKYSLILFHSSDRSPESATECFPPMQSPNEFVNLLNGLKFHGGGYEKCSQISEGLGRALQMFDDISEMRVGMESKKICFLACYSPPYELPCFETCKYAGKTADELTTLMGKKGIYLSLICPRILRPFRNLFMLANPNNPPTVNYAQDTKHLVFISGFKLPTEREPVPVDQKPAENEKSVPSVNSATSASPMQSSPPYLALTSPASKQPVVSSSQSSNIHSQPSSVQNPSSVNNTQSSPITQITDNSQNNQMMQQAGKMQNIQKTASMEAIVDNIEKSFQLHSGSNMSAPGSNMSAPGSNMQVVGSNMSALGSNMQSPGSNMQALGSNMQPGGANIQGGNMQSLGNMQSVGNIQTTVANMQSGGVNNQTGNNNMQSTGGNMQTLGGNIQQMPGMQNVGGNMASNVTNLQGGGSNNLPASGASIQVGGTNMQKTGMHQTGTNIFSTTTSGMNTNMNTSLNLKQLLKAPSQQQQQSIINTPSSGFKTNNMDPNMQQQNTSSMQNPSMVNQSMPGTRMIVTSTTMPTSNNGNFGNTQVQIRPENDNNQSNNGFNQMNQSQTVANSNSMFQSNNMVSNSVVMSQNTMQQPIPQQQPQMGNQQLQQLNPIPNQGMFNQTSMGDNKQISGFEAAKRVAENVVEIVKIQNQNQRMQKMKLWAGQIEWTEKRKIAQNLSQPPMRLTRMLMCEAFANPQQQQNFADNSVNFNSWPQKITMQLIPSVFITNLPQLKQCKAMTLSFPATSPEYVASLQNMLTKGMMGLIHMPQSPLNNNETTVVLVMYVQKKQTFFGILPINATGFMQQIRQIIVQRQRQTQSNNNAMQTSTTVTNMNPIANNAQTRFKNPQPNNMIRGQINNPQMQQAGNNMIMNNSQQNPIMRQQNNNMQQSYVTMQNSQNINQMQGGNNMMMNQSQGMNQQSQNVYQNQPGQNVHNMQYMQDPNMQMRNQRQTNPMQHMNTNRLSGPPNEQQQLRHLLQSSGQGGTMQNVNTGVRQTGMQQQTFQRQGMQGGMGNTRVMGMQQQQMQQQRYNGP